MSILTQEPAPVNLGESLHWQLDREDVRELIDEAGRWAWHVYDRIVAVLGDHELAAATAEKVQEKILGNAHS